MSKKIRPFLLWLEEKEIDENERKCSLEVDVLAVFQTADQW